MTLRHMKILVEVYRQNSVTKAAQALHLSQPSVSLALRELEDYYGVTLFERVGRRISPTECGREFYGYAVHVVSLMDELETRMRNWDAIGTVRIGATVTIGTYLLPELVRRYQAEFPALHVDVQVRRASQVEQLVLDNRIDLGLIETQPEHEELVAVPFSRDELQAIVPPGSPLAARGRSDHSGAGAVSLSDAGAGERREKGAGRVSRAAPALGAARLGERQHAGADQGRRGRAGRGGTAETPDPAGRCQRQCGAAGAERAAAANPEYRLPQAEIPLRKYAALHRAVPGDGGTVNDTVQSR